MDLDGGKPCLVTWNGKSIGMFLLGEDGLLRPLEGGRELPWEEECLGLTPCRLPGRGEPAILVSTPDLPVLLRRDGGKGWARSPLPGPEAQGPEKSTTACILADLDSDGYWDVLQPGDKSGLLWRGGASGFSTPATSSVRSPGGPGCFTLGDFNQDGFLDIFLSSPGERQLWENDGRAGFTGVIEKSGSLGRQRGGGHSSCLAADLNHDGRQDLCLLHPRDAFTYHFNRGFRCFGEEGGLRLLAPDGAGESSDGQRACAVADFNGDGSLDLAVAFTGGRVSCYYNGTFNRPLLRVGLKPGIPGPVTASLWEGKGHPLCLGALSIPGIHGKAHFGVSRPGRYTLRWRLPGRPPESRQVIIIPGRSRELILGE